VDAPFVAAEALVKPDGDLAWWSTVAGKHDVPDAERRRPLGSEPRSPYGESMLVLEAMVPSAEQLEVLDGRRSALRVRLDMIDVAADRWLRAARGPTRSVPGGDESPLSDGWASPQPTFGDRLAVNVLDTEPPLRGPGHLLGRLPSDVCQYRAEAWDAPGVVVEARKSRQSYVEIDGA
jgi:hypothetical protein